MGNFSRDTFDRMKAYVAVRLQQGVPLVDADWNEQEDIRRFELRAFLKWFVGDGVPLGNDGFRIAATSAAANDVEVRGGDGTANGAGRCLVDGWDVINAATVRYTAQRLFANAALAQTWGVAPLPALTTPTADRTDTVYLHIWEREVGAAEDRNLVNPAIGVETCVRLRREWAVRVAEGATALPAPPAGHVFYPLARLSRRAGDSNIRAEQIADLRTTGLRLMSLNEIDQIRRDAFGDGYALNPDGRRNLQISVREAMNALLRGELPSTAVAIAVGGSLLTAVENRGTVWAFSYGSSRSFTYSQDGIWTPGQEMTVANFPVLLLDQRDQLWSFFIKQRQNLLDLTFTRLSLAPGGGWAQSATGILLTLDGSSFALQAVEDVRGNISLFYQVNLTSQNNNNVYVRPLIVDTQGKVSLGTEQAVAASIGGELLTATFADSSGYLAVLYKRDSVLFGKSVARNATSELTLGAETTLWPPGGSTSGQNYVTELRPVALPGGGFVAAATMTPGSTLDTAVYFVECAWPSKPALLNVTQIATGDGYAINRPRIARDRTGAYWLFWNRVNLRTNPQEYEIWYCRVSPQADGSLRRTPPRALATGGQQTNPTPVVDQRGNVCVFWDTTVGNQARVVYRRFVTEI